MRVDLGEGRPPREIRLTQLEGEFSQPNGEAFSLRVFNGREKKRVPHTPAGAMCEKMLAWAVRATEPRAEETSRDLLELYCGNGNFTAALAPNFRNVLATELRVSPSLRGENVPSFFLQRARKFSADQ